MRKPATANGNRKKGMKELMKLLQNSKEGLKEAEKFYQAQI
jgi:hypothetical protein